jgi:hypothetical protein
MNFEKTLTLGMIDGDGYGGNLSKKGHCLTDENTIRRKTEEYNRLLGESNDPEELIRAYRRERLGRLKTTRLALCRSFSVVLDSLASKLHQMSKP